MATEILGVMAKEPVPGRVKTRLSRDTTPEWAAEVARSCLLDVIGSCAGLADERYLAHAPDGAGDFFGSLAPGRFRTTPQGGGDLGERMARFVAARFAEGAGRVVLIGTDSPGLPAGWIADAFDRLRTHDVVLGPATDGGYYLVGSRGPADIFDGIAWSSPAVLGQTARRVREAGLSLALLPPYYDIDTIDDWRVFEGHLAARLAAGEDPGLPNLRRLASFP